MYTNLFSTFTLDLEYFYHYYSRLDKRSRPGQSDAPQAGEASIGIHRGVSASQADYVSEENL